jgi:hypothetical protein
LKYDVLSSNYAIGPINSPANVTEVGQNMQGARQVITRCRKRKHNEHNVAQQISDGNELHEMCPELFSLYCKPLGKSVV